METKKKQGLSTSVMALIGVMTAIICVLSPISIPIPVSPVPISLATFAVMLAGCLLGARRGSICVILYLLIGICGIPVFSAYGAGIGKVLGPTGGYLIGYIPLVILTGLAFSRFSNPVFQGLFTVAATAVLYLLGTAWLALSAHLTFPQALMMGVIPYIPGDLVKIIIVVLVGPVIRDRLLKAGLLPDSPSADTM